MIKTVKVAELSSSRCRPKPTPVEQRFCHFWKGNVEDKVHFIVDCPTYSEIRQEFLSAHAKGVWSTLIQK